MAYYDGIDALSPDHRWSFDNTLNDQVGTVNGTGTGTSFATTPLCEDVSYSLLTDAIGDRVSIPTTTNINNSAQNRKAVAGWFAPTAIQRPPKRIYGEGNDTLSFDIVLGFGNNVIFEVVSSSFILQIYGDTFLVPNRPYHLCLIFEGNSYGNELRAYLDGVEQLNAQPTDRQPDSATLAARGVAEFGDPAGTVGIGGTVILLEACTNGRYNEWATWDGANAVLTDAEVREELFEKGALPGITISSGTQSAMQTALDSYADTVRGNEPLNIRINAVTGDGDLTLNADNITHDQYASIHVQYMGTGTLTWNNTNGSNSSIGSTPNGGTIIFVQFVSVVVTALDATDLSEIEGARVLLEAAAGGPLSEGTDVLTGLTNVNGELSTSFGYSSNQPVTGKVRKATSGTLYRQALISGVITASGLNITALLIPDI